MRDGGGDAALSRGWHKMAVRQWLMLNTACDGGGGGEMSCNSQLACASHVPRVLHHRYYSPSTEIKTFRKRHILSLIVATVVIFLFSNPVVPDIPHPPTAFLPLPNPPYPLLPSPRSPTWPVKRTPSTKPATPLPRSPSIPIHTLSQQGPNSLSNI